MNSRMTPANAPVNRGTTNIFFKTRMCVRFQKGQCPKPSQECNFAHGFEDMRQPPPNWQELVCGREDDRLSGNWDEDQKIIHKMKLCKKFYNGEECPYGERCNFLHEDPSKFRDDSGRFRESSAISINALPMTHLGDSVSIVNSECNRSVTTSSEVVRSNVKPVYWKTKLCIKWETTGQCPFGDKCHFAHGQAELQASNQAEAGSMGGLIPPVAKPVPVPANDAPPCHTAIMPASTKEEQGKKCLLKWKGSKKINRIYADWLDDMPLALNLPSRVET